jgi:hypothetical protein
MDCPCLNSFAIRAAVCEPEPADRQTYMAPWVTMHVKQMDIGEPEEPLNQSQKQEKQISCGTYRGRLITGS